MSKKLLSEAEMRRFMGLAGISSNLISNRLTEAGMHGYNEEDEDPMDADSAAAMDEPAELPAPELDAEEPAEEPEMMDQPEDMPAPSDEALEGLSDEMKEELFSAVANAAAEVLDLDIDMEMSDAGDAEEAPEMDVAPELPDAAPAMDDMEAEEPAEMDMEEEPVALEEENITLELSEEEIVNEVARRVAKRLVKASKANKTLKEALGRK